MNGDYLMQVAERVLGMVSGKDAWVNIEETSHQWLRLARSVVSETGSRGQIRTALMAVKLAEVAWLKEKTGEWPVLLLDEILAELDVQRRADLLAALAECEQSLLTTTDLNLFPAGFAEHATLWQVSGGRIIA